MLKWAAEEIRVEKEWVQGIDFCPFTTSLHFFTSSFLSFFFHFFFSSSLLSFLSSFSFLFTCNGSVTTPTSAFFL